MTIAKFRTEKAAQGIERFEVYCRREDRPAIAKLVARLNARRAKKACNSGNVKRSYPDA